MGFGWLNSADKYDFTLTYKVKIDFTDTPEYEIDLTQDMLEEKKADDNCQQTFLIDFK
jgi:hypothetical protein